MGNCSGSEANDIDSYMKSKHLSHGFQMLKNIRAPQRYNEVRDKQLRIGEAGS